MLKKIIFSEVSPLIKLGYRRPLELNDLPQLPELWNPDSYIRGFDELHGQQGGKSLILQVLKKLAPQAKRLGILLVFILSLKMLSPVLIHQLIEAVGLATKGELSLAAGIMTALALCIVQLLGAILGQHYVYHAVTSTQSAVNGINQRICQAILRSRTLGNKKGQVINRANSDAELAGATLWAVGEVVQISLTMLGTSALLFYYLGTAAIAPLIIMATLMPLSRWFSGRFARIQTEIMSHRDERVGRMSQFLDGIRIIKSFVWESVVKKQIGSIRERENNAWKKLINYKAVSTASYLFASLLVGLVGFGIYIWQGNTLTAATAFTCLTLFGYLEPCFRQLPKILGEMSSSLVAGERIASLLLENDTHTLDQELPVTKVAPSLDLFGLSVDYDEKKNALKGIDLKINRGESIAIIGPVGSGKSTLLKAILGELHPQEGEILFNQTSSRNFSTAYVPQDPFLFHGTLEENINLGKPMRDEMQLDQALFASCLDHDLVFMPAGLRTEISEGGGNFSGGQKQRVNLARAAMHDPELVLMDDPLSALDPVTEKEVVDRLIFGLWKDCTRLVTTHRLEHLRKFDRIIFIQDGVIKEQGSFSELLAKSPEFQQYYFEHQKEDEEEVKVLTESKRVASPILKVEKVENTSVVEIEEQKTGEVSLKLYWDYFKAMANFSKKNIPKTISLLLITSLSAMLLPIAQNTWISKWTQSLSDSSTAGDHLHYLLIYAGIGLLTLFVCAFQHFYWARKAIDAAQILHNTALQGVLSTVLRFFDANPSGRILNRFSRDLDAVEKDLSWSLEEAFMALLNSIGAVFVMLAALPFMGLVVLPVLGLYWFLQKTYRSCMREAKRLMAVARSPRISSIKEILDGSAVIRCYRAEDFFQKRFTEALADYQRSFYSVVLINRWFSIRIPLVSSLLSCSAAVGVIFMGRYGGISEGIAGMALVYAFRFWDSLNWTVRAFGEAEAQMTSVERLESMAGLTKEISHEVEDQAQLETTGEISFNNVIAGYAPHLPNVLKGASFKVATGSKVGVIGRTGAGKSTLFNLLHRFIECKEGEILIGDSNIKDLPLFELRQSIATIPQNPILFAGTIQDNLDPMNCHTKEELERILELAHLNFLSHGLQTMVADGGNNFSRGQKQLICLARALVCKSKIIIVDEATASVDGKTDSLIREILMNECPDLTVLIIAHKLQSVSKCDMIIEMRDGKVLKTTYPLLEKDDLERLPA
jgi:ABC-type multidrug transport system fused ATPase/permease subunit